MPPAAAPMAKPEQEHREELEDRDPNNLSRHLQVEWEEVVGEGSVLRSPECAWRLSALVFRRAHSGCYALLTVLLAPPVALLLACVCAAHAFQQTWCCRPLLACARVQCASVRELVRACSAALVAPPASALGHALRHVRLNAPEERDVLLV